MDYTFDLAPRPYSQGDEELPLFPKSMWWVISLVISSMWLLQSLCNKHNEVMPLSADRVIDHPALDLSVILSMRLKHDKGLKGELSPLSAGRDVMRSLLFWSSCIGWKATIAKVLLLCLKQRDSTLCWSLMATFMTFALGLNTPPKVHQECCTLVCVLNSTCLHLISASSKLEPSPSSNVIIQRTTHSWP